MEDKSDKVLRNQEILNKNQLAIYGVLMKIEEKLPSGGKEFLGNYLADIAGTITAGLGLVDISDTLRKR